MHRTMFGNCTTDELRECIGDEAFARLVDFARRREELAQLFEQRNELCRSMRFADYEAYRKSSLWKKLSKEILQRDGKICVRCEGKANQVHHRSYSLEVLEGGLPEQLASICEGCHNVVHKNEHGADRFADEWDAILNSKELRNDFPPVTIDRRRGRFKHPPEWKRMTDVQRAGWNAERDRQYDLWLLKGSTNS